MRDSEVRSNTYRAGRAAIGRLKKDKTRYDWLQVGESLMEARAEARENLGIDGTNLPSNRLGSAYNQELGRILKRERLDADIVDTKTRGLLYKIMGSLPAIDAELQRLDPHERARCNHPSSIWRAYEKALAEPKKKEGPKPPTALAEATVRAADMTETARYNEQLLIEAMAIIVDLGDEASVRARMTPGLAEYYTAAVQAKSKPVEAKAEGDGKAALAKLDKLIGGAMPF